MGEKLLGRKFLIFSKLATLLGAEGKECEQGCYFCWSGAFSSENSCYRKPPKRGKFMAFPSKGGQAFRIQLMNTAHSAQTIEALKSRSLL